jgi:putative ABC transport system permease protein
MKARDVVYVAFDNMAAHKLRSSLTLLGVIFGVGAVISMLAIGAGAEVEALRSIARLGLHNVVIEAKVLQETEATEIRAKSVGVSLRDAEAIRDAVPGVERVAPVVGIDPYSVLSSTGSAEGVSVLGVPGDYRRLVGLEVVEGRFLDALDVRDHAQVAVIGDELRRDLFGTDVALGRELKIEDVWVRVVGVLGSTGASGDGSSGGGIAAAAFGSSGAEAGAPGSEGEGEGAGVAVGGEGRRIYLPVSTALRKFDRRPLDSPLSKIIVRLEQAESARRASSAIARLLETLHAGADDYELVVPEALLAESRRTQRMFSLVMGCIAGISLLVGGIGIMNIMLASVLERTREIGLRRAVGARRRDILVQFVAESFTLSAVGGLAGVVMGVTIAELIAASAGWPTVVRPWSIVLATGVALFVGLVSGLYPAIRAAEIDPIESLRQE